MTIARWSDLLPGPAALFGRATSAVCSSTAPKSVWPGPSRGWTALSPRWSAAHVHVHTDAVGSFTAVIHILMKGGVVQRIGRSTLDSFQRVKEFISQHPFAGSPQNLGEQALELDDVILQVSSGMVDQESGARFTGVHAEYEATLRQVLYGDHMQPIAQIARDVLGASSMDKAFRLPTGNRNVNRSLITAARAMAAAAEREKDVFLRHGRPQDFIEQLRSAAEALEEARLVKTENIRRRVTATKSVRDQLKRGRKAVRLLNAVLMPTLRKQPELLAAWKSAKRVRPTTLPVVAGVADAALKAA